MAMKPCPHCAHMIHDESRICVHCRRSVLPKVSKIRPPMICDKCGDIGETGHLFMAHYWVHVLVGLLAMFLGLFLLAAYLLRAGV